jgi:hypothetical protein
MEVGRDKGREIHIGPEPCVGIREGYGEASAGEYICQAWSPPEVTWLQVSTWSRTRRATCAGAKA